ETAVQIGQVSARQTGFSDRVARQSAAAAGPRNTLSASNLLPSSGTFFASIIIGYHGFPVLPPGLLSLLPLPALQRSIKLNIDISYNAPVSHSPLLFGCGSARFFSPPPGCLILQPVLSPSLAGMGKLLTSQDDHHLPVPDTSLDAYFDQSNLVAASFRYVTTADASGAAAVPVPSPCWCGYAALPMGKEDAIRALKALHCAENSECVRLNKQIKRQIAPSRRTYD
uniref:OAR domain-containing protein n=1 Tax=Macrostomum lignano TaxID=282301 RepID=A0A1I8FKN7_9PLAT